MASPQKENGYTAIANELIEAVCSRLSNSTHIRILFWTMRLTYGWRRIETVSNYSSYAKKLKLKKDTIKAALGDLADRKVIIIAYLSPEKFIIKVNKDYEKWKLG